MDIGQLPLTFADSGLFFTCKGLLTIFHFGWLFRASTILRPNPGAFPMLVTQLGTAVPAPGITNPLLLQLQKHLKTFLFAGPSTDAI